jgi:hypothetical protein
MDPDDETIFGAIQQVFPMNTEDAVMSWNRILIKISYKYDLSQVIYDVLDLLEWVIAGHDGRRLVQWGSSTFFGVWNLSRRGDELEITAEWQVVVGDLEKELNARPTVVMSASAFLREWKRPLEIVMSALVGAGYTEKLGGFGRLRDLVARIDAPGVLYGPTAEPTSIGTGSEPTSLRNVVAALDGYERLVVEVELAGSKLLSVARVSKEGSAVMAELDFRAQGAGLVSMPLADLVNALRAAENELLRTYPEPAPT